MKCNVRTGEATIGSTKINLTRNEIVILNIITNKRGITTLEEIYEAVYKVKVRTLTNYDKRLLYVNVNRLKKKLNGLIEIKSHYGYGYEVINYGKI